MRDLVACDTETTGFEPETCSLLEVAAVSAEAGDWTYVEFEGNIPPDAKATHHILEEHVRPGASNCIHRDAAIEMMTLASFDSVMVFHNAKFDLGFLPEFRERAVICTLQCAKHLWPDAPNFKNQTLRYWKNTRVRLDLLEGLSPHRAMYDAAVTLSIAERMLEEGSTVEDLLRLTNEPVLLTTVNFGKYKGDKWKDVPRDYRQWMRRSGNWADDRDVMHTLDVLDGRKVA